MRKSQVCCSYIYPTKPGKKTNLVGVFMHKLVVELIISYCCFLTNAREKKLQFMRQIVSLWQENILALFFTRVLIMFDQWRKVLNWIIIKKVLVVRKWKNFLRSANGEKLSKSTRRFNEPSSFVSFTSTGVIVLWTWERNRNVYYYNFGNIYLVFVTEVKSFATQIYWQSKQILPK